MSDCNRYIICYPGGSGGSFVAAALNKVLNNTEFQIDQELGHCHQTIGNMPNFFHGDTIQSLTAELDNIQSFNFKSKNVILGHYRNIVAIKEMLTSQLGYHALAKTKFIKISVNAENYNEILFVASMLRKKANCFLDISMEEYLIQATNYIKSWYWVENYYTALNTVELLLSDIFLNRISVKINLPESLTTELDQYQAQYQAVQQQLYCDLLDLINE